VSDNSSNDAVEAMVKADFPTVHYVRRVPMLPAMQHFSRCIDDVNTDYFCLFHDDDLMRPHFVQEMRNAARANPKAIALGCNAVIEVFGRPQAAHSFLARKEYETIDSAQDLAARYFSRSQSGIAPFPGYVYHTQLVGGLRFLTDGGKYADVTWLLELARRAALVWIRQPLMTYRMHGGNDGNTESRRDRLRFLSYLKRNRSWLGEHILQDYRCSFIYKTLVKEAGASSSTHRVAVARKFLAIYRWARYGRVATYKALIERALVKRAQQT
jgi:GT2 family glycosyltransferase